MGAYDSSKFSKQFSERTGENLKFIKDRVNRDETICETKKAFKGEYDRAIELINELVVYVRNEAKNIVNVKKKGKDELTSKMYSVADRLQKSRSKFEGNLNTIEAINVVNNKEIYEVTQLINSLMGIAVLPYELHKNFFSKQAIMKEGELKNKGKNTKRISQEEAYDILCKNQESLRINNYAYDGLYDFIIKLYEECYKCQYKNVEKLRIRM